VVDHYQAGVQPMEKVQGEIQNKLYSQKMEPALRSYLAEMREESYVNGEAGLTRICSGCRRDGDRGSSAPLRIRRKRRRSGHAEGGGRVKSQFIADLADGQSVSSSFLVREKEVRTSAKSGKSWLHLDLMDPHGPDRRKNVGQFFGDSFHIRS